MTDHQLRSLRRHAVAGDPRAEAAWLRARVRAGELSGAQLRLAAYLGSAAAAGALDETAGGVGELAGWVRGLRRFSKEACVRAAVAAAELVIRDDEAYALPGRALRAARRWVDCPCRSCAGLAEEAIGDVRVRFTRRERAALEAARAAAGVLHPPREPQYRHVYSTSRRARKAARYAATRVGEERVRAAIRSALIPWALGLAPSTPEQRVGLARPRPTPFRWLEACVARVERQRRDRALWTQPPSEPVPTEPPTAPPASAPDEGWVYVLVALAVLPYVVRAVCDLCGWLS